MTVRELKESLSLTEIAMPCPDREVVGAYVGDLLSWVMGRARENGAWITIMSNVNVVAVASLVDVSLVILAEGVRLDEKTEQLANEKGVNVLSSTMSSFEISGKLSSLKI